MKTVDRSTRVRQPGSTRPFRPWIIGLLIVSPAATSTLTLWANNLGQVPKTYRHVLVVTGFALVGVAMFLILRRVLSDSRVSGFITFFFLLATTSGGRLMDGGPWILRWAIALGAVLVAALIVLRLRDLWLLEAVVVGCAAALLVPPILTGTWALVSGPQRSAIAPPAVSVPTMLHQPDIVLVIVDGYTSLPVMKQLFGFEDVALRGDLESVGFTVIEPAFSPYPMTHLSVSSLLELDYVAEERPRTTTADGRTLEQVMGGDSYLVELLVENGYRITMVESGWHMSTCGEQIDVCVPDRFVDEGVGTVLSQSLLWSFLEPSVGSAFTHGARHAMSWTTKNIGGLVNDEIPDFVFVHVLAPHPPLLLDSDCEVVADHGLAGLSLNIVGMDADTAQARLDGYVAQVQCVNRFVRNLSEAVSGSDALVFVTGDHGSDAFSQLATLPDQWSDFQVLERASVFLAINTPPGCENASSLVSVALFRSLVSCVGDLGLEPIEEKSYLLSLDNDQPANMRNLDTEEIEALARCLELLDEDLECS